MVGVRVLSELNVKRSFTLSYFCCETYIDLQFSQSLFETHHASLTKANDFNLLVIERMLRILDFYFDLFIVLCLLPNICCSGHEAIDV
jgi:hypothetical protein